MQNLLLVSLMTFYVNSLVIAHEKFENCIKLALEYNSIAYKLGIIALNSKKMVNHLQYLINSCVMSVLTIQKGAQPNQMQVNAILILH